MYLVRINSQTIILSCNSLIGRLLTAQLILLEFSYFFLHRYLWMNIETISIDDKSIVKTPFQIPSPTILLPNEFSSSPKPISNTRNL